MKKGSVRKLLAASVLACSASVSQASLVQVWDYTVNMAWTDATFSTAADWWNSSNKFSPTMLSWGYKHGVDGLVLNGATSAHYARSSLEITQPRGTGQVGSNSGVRQVNMFTHTNNEINSTYGYLTSATLSVSVNLSPDGSGVPVQALTKDFTVYFIETPNIGGTCAWGNCSDDLFAFVVLPEIYDVFTYNGYTYTFNYFQTSGSNAITQYGADVCSVISGGLVTTSCYGFQTPESAKTTLQFGFSITADPITVVPEPQTYVMLLAGLCIVGAVARRRRNAIRD